MSADPTPNLRFARRLTAASGELATDATVRMESTYPWYRQLSADERAWVGLVAQAGISAFLEWVADPQEAPRLTADIFGSAPRELARVISLEQTVALVRTTIEVVESAIDALLDEPDRSAAREATLRYSREVAFSAAEVYARAAEARGAWDARLESLIVDSILREELDPSVASRISALGWSDATPVAVVAGFAPVSDVEGSLDVLRRAARNHELLMLSGMHGEFLIALVGRSETDEHAIRAARLMAPHFGPGPVVIGERAADFEDVGASVRTAAAAVRAAVGGRMLPDRSSSPICCPSGPWPVKNAPASNSSTPAFDRWPPNRTCWSPRRPTWSARRRWKAPRGGSSCIPIRCATGSGGSPTHRLHPHRPARRTRPAPGPDPGPHRGIGRLFVGLLQVFARYFGHMPEGAL